MFLKCSLKGNKLAQAVQNYYAWNTPLNLQKSFNLLNEIFEEKSFFEKEEDWSYPLILIGFIYEKGIKNVLVKNAVKALEFYEKASELNNSEAMFNIAEINMKNVYGIEINIQRSLKFYEKAVELNHQQAINNLAIYYENNEDYEKSIEILNRGVELNHPNAMKRLGEIYLNGKKNIEKNIDKSAFYFFKAFETTSNSFDSDKFRYILRGKQVEWREQYHNHWNAPKDLNLQIILLLLISKKRKSSKNLLIPNLFVKGIAMKVIKFLCHFMQIDFEKVDQNIFLF
jgi:tetratricopeptide (TPR) repeat protein